MCMYKTRTHIIAAQHFRLQCYGIAAYLLPLGGGNCAEGIVVYCPALVEYPLRFFVYVHFLAHAVATASTYRQYSWFACHHVTAGTGVVQSAAATR